MSQRITANAKLVEEVSAKIMDLLNESKEHYTEIWKRCEVAEKCVGALRNKVKQMSQTIEEITAAQQNSEKNNAGLMERFSIMQHAYNQSIEAKKSMDAALKQLDRSLF